MKLAKGTAGYIRKKKQAEILKTAVEFGIVAAMLIMGYAATKTRLNWLTLFAILGCLPACKALVGVIMLLPRTSIEEEKAKAIEEKSESLVRAYDLVLTSYEHVMPLESIVIKGNTVCGYTSNQKIDLKYTENYIKKNLSNHYYDKASVKIFDDFQSYLTRVEGMTKIAENEQATEKNHEEGIKKVILSLSI